MKTVSILLLLLLPYSSNAQQVADIPRTDVVMTVFRTPSSISYLESQVQDFSLLPTPVTQTVFPAVSELLITQPTPVIVQPAFLHGFDCDAVVKFENLSAALRLRSLNDGSENENTVLTIKPYTIFDLSALYRFENLQLFVVIENVFNEAWNEAQFDTGMQLWAESPDITSVLHLMTCSPRSLRLGVIYNY